MSVFVADAFSFSFALQPINKKKIDKIAVNSVIDLFILSPLIDNNNH
ncbi:Iron compound ABC transporter, iron compound-binding protein [Bacillus mycoides DSM 2048]|nr:Iron compound ABC transporter, iron compound-binding protein [Bacillus mycoides DSM 2048]